VNEGARLIALQRRVQSDPAPFAEEYRRAGRLSEAVACCRTGLQRHPGYLSARLILARSLSALARWEEAAEEYEQVVAAAPDNLAATRELAEICEKRGRKADSLTYYRRALALARNDRSLEDAIERLSSEAGARTVAPEASPPAPPPPARSVRPNARQVDFDAVLSLLGRPHQQPPPLTERLLTDPASLLPAATAEIAASAAAVAPADDALAALEQDLRDHFDHALAGFPIEGSAAATSTPGQDKARIEAAVIRALEAWLEAIARDRNQTRSS
jgi:tetratricopeptide (TPR) repeat protein